jgi:arabinofuranan 3-O-arabinosyltransferase
VSVAIEDGADAVIVPERSVGQGFWAEVKALERACYRGDDLIEAPRFVRRNVWMALGGLDHEIAGGGDDWDLHIRLRQAGFSVNRVLQEVLHNEGRLTLRRLAKKRFRYGQYVWLFIRKHGWKRAASHYNPLRRGYAQRNGSFSSRPRHLAGLIVMRTVEYGAGALGMLAAYSTPRGR